MDATDTIDEADHARREVFGWQMWDWASSAFSTTVTTALLGPYLVALADERGGVSLLGFDLEGASLWSFAVALSAFMQVLILPLTGVVADHTDQKKQLLVNCTYVSAGLTVALFALTESTILLGAGLYVLAATALSSAGVVANSYLPQIAPIDVRDRVSSSGVAYGYLGGGLWLAANFVLLTLMDDQGLAVRISLAGTGVWMALFTALTTHRMLQARPRSRTKPDGVGWLRFTATSVVETITELNRNYPVALRFLIAYLVYFDGASTIITISTVFAADELGAETSTLLLIVLMIQFMAVPGSLFFGRLAGRIGTKAALQINLAGWLGLVVYAFGFLDSIPKLWGMAVVLAFVLGGIQALSRSLFSQLIPASKEAEYFGFYEISSRGTSWIGPLMFGLANEVFDSQRVAILSLIVFFLAGMAINATVDVQRGRRDAGQEHTSPVG